MGDFLTEVGKGLGQAIIQNPQYIPEILKIGMIAFLAYLAFVVLRLLRTERRPPVPYKTHEHFLNVHTRLLTMVEKMKDIRI